MRWYSHFFIGLILQTIIYSQTVSDYTYTGAEATSLCGAVVANPGGVWSLYHNPAGISEIEDIQIEFGMSRLFNQSYLPYSNAGTVIQTNDFGNFGVSLQQMAIQYGGNNLSTEISIGFSHGLYLLKDMNSTLSVGYSLNYLYWDLGKSAGVSGDGSDGIELGSTGTVGVDIGIQSSLRDKHRVGIYMKNVNQPEIGEGLSNQPLPRRLSIGAAYTPMDGIVTSIVMDRLLGSEIQVKSGLSFEFSDLLTINIGLQSNPNRMGGGLKIHHSGFSLNYAVLTHHVLPITHLFSIGYIIEK